METKVLCQMFIIKINVSFGLNYYCSVSLVDHWLS